MVFEKKLNKTHIIKLQAFKYLIVTFHQGAADTIVVSCLLSMKQSNY